MSGTSTPLSGINPLEGFSALTDQIYVQTPPTSAVDPSHPTTIVIYGWGDALPKHVLKYITGYRALFPTSRIVLVFSPILRALLQTLDARTANMQPVVDVLFGTLSEKGIALDGKTLMHCMSNTGGINLAATMNAYRTQHDEPLPYKMMVLDSTPGSTDFWPNIGRWSRAMALGAAGVPLPFFMLKGIAFGFLSTLQVVGWTIGRVSAAEYSVQAVNQPELSSMEAKRLYLYSKEDDIIHWQDIEAHAALARTLGYDVEMELFDGTPHVGHMREWPEQYWGKIKETWDGIVKKE
ncbi:hypothetical protein QBC34DRAFT_385104 [Podospora aff. communis PSN243]|uniref:Uncharacterized protein n=1 Tax=Podospora aff. communis PSN243 TaxID=3040156 RepID=A0AAV9G8Z1_9PEZI|nr:hypothetical protein QBC34DRAFT_385104 [Podospora aff. communis PSN243]